MTAQPLGVLDENFLLRHHRRLIGFAPALERLLREFNEANPEFANRTEPPDEAHWMRVRDWVGGPTANDLSWLDQLGDRNEFLVFLTQHARVIGRLAIAGESFARSQGDRATRYLVGGVSPERTMLYPVPQGPALTMPTDWFLAYEAAVGES